MKNDTRFSSSETCATKMLKTITKNYLVQQMKVCCFNVVGMYETYMMSAMNS